LEEGEEVFAWEYEDTLLCQDGLALPIDGYRGQLSLFNFQTGVYICGKKVKSFNAGRECSSYEDCPTNVEGLYAECGCSFSNPSKICGIMNQNTEALEHVEAA